MSRSTARIESAFQRATGEDRAALIVYITAGHPHPDLGLEMLLAIADAGADVIEVGVPFSDPLADGPTIQKSSFDAIAAGVDLVWTLEMLRQFRARRDTAVVLFSYLNPVLDFGVDRFLSKAAAAGADGVLLTDLPVDADPEMERVIEESPLDLVRLIAPTTLPERARYIAERSQGFAYYISRTGVTGTGAQLAAGLREQVAALKAGTSTPIAVGFGISNAEQAATVAEVADGIIVGSAVVAAASEGGVERARDLVAALRTGGQRTVHTG